MRINKNNKNNNKVTGEKVSEFFITADGWVYVLLCFELLD